MHHCTFLIKVQIGSTSSPDQRAPQQDRGPVLPPAATTCMEQLQGCFVGLARLFKIPPWVSWWLILVRKAGVKVLENLLVSLAKYISKYRGIIDNLAVCKLQLFNHHLPTIKPFIEVSPTICPYLSTRGKREFRWFLVNFPVLGRVNPCFL